MLSTIREAARRRPLMSSLIGLIVGTTSAVTAVSLPQMQANGSVGHYRLAEGPPPGGPPPGGDMGGGPPPGGNMGGPPPGGDMGGQNFGGPNMGGSNFGGPNMGPANQGPNFGGPNMGGPNGQPGMGGPNMGPANQAPGTNDKHFGEPNFGGPNMGGPNGQPGMGNPGMGGQNFGGPNMGQNDQGHIFGGPNGQPGMSGPNFGGPNMGGPNGQPGMGNPGMGGPNFGGPNMGQGEQGMNGPSEEEMTKQRKVMDDRQLAMMKNGFKQPQNELKRMVSMFAKFQKQGVTIPTDCQEAMDQAKSIVDAVVKVSSIDEWNDIGVDQLGDHFQTINECRQRFEMLAQVPKMLKKADSEIKRIGKRWAQFRKSAPETASDAVADGDAAIQAMKDAREKLATLLKSGEIEDLQSIMEDDLYGRFDDVDSAIQRIDAAKNARKFFTQFAREIKRGKQTITKMKKMGKDTSNLEEIMRQAQAKYNEIRAMKAGSEEFFDAVQELAEMGQEFSQNVGGLEQHFQNAPSSQKDELSLPIEYQNLGQE